MRHVLPASSLAAAISLTACSYNLTNDTEPPAPAPLAAETSGAPAAASAAGAAEPAPFGDRVVTISRTPGQAPPPETTIAAAADAGRAGDAAENPGDEASGATQADRTVGDSVGTAGPVAPPKQTDLTPATDDAEDARAAASDALSQARSSFDQAEAAGPIAPQSETDLTPATNAAEDARSAASDALRQARSSLDQVEAAGPIAPQSETDLTPATNAAEDARSAASDALTEGRSSFKRPVSSDRARNGTPDGLDPGNTPDRTPDLTPATDNPEDRRQVRKSAIEQSRSSFKRSVSSDRGREAVPTADGPDVAGLASGRGRSAPGSRNRLLLDGESEEVTGTRTMAADGIEEIVVPVMPNATEATPPSAPAAGRSFFRKMAGRQTVLPYRHASEPAAAPSEK